MVNRWSRKELLLTFLTEHCCGNLLGCVELLWKTSGQSGQQSGTITGWRAKERQKVALRE
jgi:hypothetical protein